MTTLVLERHAQSIANMQRVFAGHSDFPLSETGHLQARCTARYLAEHYRIDAVYTSDLQRAHQTAEHFADIAGLPIRDLPQLREIYAGAWEGLPFTRITELYAADYGRWRNDIGNAVCTGGEAVAALARRILEAVTKIAEENDGKTVLIATHATPIRALQCLLTGRPLTDMKDIPWVTNASVTTVTYNSGNWQILRVSEDAHLTELVTSLPPNV